MFKKGDRIEWNYNGDHSTGTVIRMGTLSDEQDQDHVYAEWDGEGAAYADIKHAKLLLCERGDLTEESAVMFLLNRGYTITKKS